MLFAKISQDWSNRKKIHKQEACFRYVHLKGIIESFESYYIINFTLGYTDKLYKML